MAMGVNSLEGHFKLEEGLVSDADSITIKNDMYTHPLHFSMFDCPAERNGATAITTLVKVLSLKFPEPLPSNLLVSRLSRHSRRLTTF